VTDCKSIINAFGDLVHIAFAATLPFSYHFLGIAPFAYRLAHQPCCQAFCGSGK
jgi:hypothetical protein